MSASLAIRNNPIQTVMDYVGQDEPAAQKSVAKHLDQPFAFADLPEGILANHVIPFLLRAQDDLFVRDGTEANVRTVVMTNKLWQRAAIDWIKGTIERFDDGELHRVNVLLKKYTCLRPITANTLLNICREREISYVIDDSSSLADLTREAQQIEAYHMRIRYLNLNVASAVSAAHLDRLIPNGSLSSLRIYGVNSLTEEEIINLLDKQTQLSRLELTGKNLSDTAVDAIGKTSSKTLTHLTLSCCQNVHSDSWAALFKRCQNLKSVEIHRLANLTLEALQILPANIEDLTLETEHAKFPHAADLIRLADRCRKLQLKIDHRTVDIHWMFKIEVYARLHELGRQDEAKRVFTKAEQEKFDLELAKIKRMLPGRTLSTDIRATTYQLINKATSFL